MTQRSQIAVIGSGPGGAVAACALAEAGRDVLLVEEGPRLALESCRPFSTEEMVQKYRHGGVSAALGSCPVAYVEGRVVGGGSEVNSALYHRAPADRLEEWARRFRVEALSEKDLAAQSEAIEADLTMAADSSRLHPAGMRLAQGAERLGLPCRQALRMAQAGDGRTAGQRQAMSKTYIPRALQAGCRLLEETRVLRLTWAAGRWVCRARRGGASLDIEAEKVFLACGAIQTPHLLRRSGLGGHAGASLALHPTVKLVAEFADEVNGPDLGVAAQQVKPVGMRYGFGCSLSSPSNLALALLDHPEALTRVAADWRRMAVYYAMVPGTGCGEIRSLPACRDPLVRYRASADDLGGLGEGLRRLAELLFAAGAKRVYPSAGGLGPWSSAAEAGGAAALTSSDARLITIHLMGSCPMGEDRGLCVADSFGKVHGSDGLWLADASLLCGPVGVNPQGTVMALSRRNALRALGKL